MTITYITNFLNHHTEPLAQELYALLGDDFCFLETKPPKGEAEFQRGYAFAMAANEERKNHPWCIRAYEPQAWELAREKADSADAVIIANASDDWILSRLKAGKLTFRAHERWFHQGIAWYRRPKAMVGAWLHHGRFPSLYLLSASAYTAADAMGVGVFRNKSFWWGYFPELRPWPGRQTSRGAVRLLWAGRMVDWKCTADALRACRRLKDRGISFVLECVGDGPELETLQAGCRELDLTGEVSFPGALPPGEVRARMEQADIFLFTSNSREGWGVVLNEAMNSGCAVVASHAAGASPLLIRHGENGLLYPCGDVQALAEALEKLIQEPELRKRMGRRAYDTIVRAYSPQVAAKRLIGLSEALLQGNPTPEYGLGPAGRAFALPDHWIANSKTYHMEEHQ